MPSARIICVASTASVNGDENEGKRRDDRQLMCKCQQETLDRTTAMVWSLANPMVTKRSSHQSFLGIRARMQSLAATRLVAIAMIVTEMI